MLRSFGIKNVESAPQRAAEREREKEKVEVQQQPANKTRGATRKENISSPCPVTSGDTNSSTVGEPARFNHFQILFHLSLKLSYGAAALGQQTSFFFFLSRPKAFFIHFSFEFLEQEIVVDLSYSVSTRSPKRNLTCRLWKKKKHFFCFTVAGHQQKEYDW